MTPPYSTVNYDLHCYILDLEVGMKRGYLRNVSVMYPVETDCVHRANMSLVGMGFFQKKTA